VADRFRSAGGVGQEQVGEADFEQVGDAVELAPAHVAHLLDQVLPVHGVVHPLPAGEAAEQVGLLLGPEEDVGVVEAAHGGEDRAGSAGSVGERPPLPSAEFDAPVLQFGPGDRDHEALRTECSDFDEVRGYAVQPQEAATASARAAPTAPLPAAASAASAWPCTSIRIVYAGIGAPCGHPGCPPRRIRCHQSVNSRTMA
jgi:hypothetical protein